MFYYLLSGLSMSIDGARIIIKAIDWALWSASVVINIYQQPCGTALKMIAS